jgi:hypothetical protein
MAGGYTGALKKFDNALGDIPEAFGRMIAQNPIVIAGIEQLSAGLIATAEYIDEFSTFVINNSETIKEMAIAFGIAGTAAVAYAAYQNMATIATVAAKVATIALNSAMTLTPYGLIIAGVAGVAMGFQYLYKNLDTVVGALKLGLGYALQAVTIQLQMFLTGLSKVVGFFNEEWGKSLQNVADKIDGVSKNLIESGRAQMDAAAAAKKSAQSQSTDAMMIQRATSGITDKIKETEQEIIQMQNAFSKAAESAQAVFSNLKEFMPRMNLNEFRNDAKNWEKSIQDLKTQAEALKVKLQVGVQDDEVKAQLDKINEQISYSLEAQKALKIKTSIEERGALLKEEQIKLDQIKAKEISASMEISQMRLQAANDLRSSLIEVETQRILQQRGLETADQQAGISIKQAAQLQANEAELAAFSAKLEAEKNLAIDVESQKQLAIAQMKAAALSTSTSGGAQAAQDVEVIQAQMKQVELERLRQADIISEQEYQNQLTQVKIDSMNMRTEQELALMMQRQQLLGTSPEAEAMAIEAEKLKAQNELLILQEKYASQMITDEEFRIAKEEAELASAERMSQIKQNMINRDIQQNQQLNNQWAVTLGKIRLEQEKHGRLMGTIRGIQQSTEYAAAQQGLSDLSSLRSSSDRKAFEAGKVAAIAQATVQTFLAATGAYASLAPIPIVGPALGVAAAAAAIAAGINNVAQIKSQKFQGAAHGGIDEVPKSMNNSTFVLKAGERVVQPDQNKSLGEAIDKINNGESNGGHNITVQIMGNASSDTVAEMKDAIIDILRNESERGTPIINERGIVKV